MSHPTHELPRTDSTTPIDLLEDADPLTMKQALAERERLETQLDELVAVAKRRGARTKEIAAELKTLAKAYKIDVAAAAANGQPEVGDDYRNKRTELERELESLADMAKPSKQAMEKVRRELHYLIVQQSTAFSKHAEALAAAAVKRLDAIRDQYTDAYTAWEQAKTEWDRLVSHHNYARQPAKTIARPEHGLVERNVPPKLGNAPAPPIPNPGLVFGQAPPRPKDVPEGEPLAKPTAVVMAK